MPDKIKKQSRNKKEFSKTSTDNLSVVRVFESRQASTRLEYQSSTYLLNLRGGPPVGLI